MQVIDLHLYLKCHSSSRGVFQNFASKNQLPGFYINGTLVENGFINLQQKSGSNVDGSPEKEKSDLSNKKFHVELKYKAMPIVTNKIPFIETHKMTFPIKNLNIENQMAEININIREKNRTGTLFKLKGSY